MSILKNWKNIAIPAEIVAGSIGMIILCVCAVVVAGSVVSIIKLISGAINNPDLLWIFTEAAIEGALKFYALAIGALLVAVVVRQIRFKHG